jgi:nucleoside-diphosphate-sugar epimerase
MMKRVAVTGATGLIGRHVLPLLEQRGIDVRALSRRACRAGSAEVVLGDLTDPKAVGQLLEGADAVIHLAGVAHTALWTREDHENAWKVNVGGTQLLLERCKALGVRRALLASSAHVYKEHSGFEVNESAPTGDDDFYSKTKVAIEHLAATAVQGIEIIIVRPCLTYGAGARFNLERIMRAVDRGYYFHLSGHDPMRSFLSAHNAAAAMVHLLDHGGDRQTYNIADEHPESLMKFVNRLADRMGRRPPRTLPYGLVRAAALVLTPLTRLGVKVPLDCEALAKLTKTFTISVNKLAETGFAWPDTGDRAQQQMIEFYLAAKQRTPES